MADIGVFHANEFNSTYFTRCCEVAILDHQDRCPACGGKVVPAKERWQSATGSKHLATQMRWREKYRAEGREQADRVRARIEGIPYVITRLCNMCGEPIDRCHC